MRAQDSGSRFLFRGHAIPVIGRIRRPNDTQIPALAVSATSIDGGSATASVVDPEIPGGVITCKKAESSIDGDFEDPNAAVQYTHGNHGENSLPARTRLWINVEDLSIVNEGDGTSHTVTVDKIELTMTGLNRRNGDQAGIKLEKAAITGLKLDGYGVNVEICAKMYTDKDTHKKLCDAYDNDEQFYQQYGDLFFTPPQANAGKRKMPQAGGYIHATAANKVTWAGTPHPDATIEGNKITLKDFGSIYLAELFISDFSRRVTMMRLQLGSPIGGNIMLADGESNGISWPP